MHCAICHATDHRHACARCLRTARQRLRELEWYAAILAATTGPVRREPGRHAPGYGSRPPVRLSAVVMLDRRSTTEQLGDDDETTPTWSIVGTLAGIAGYVRRHRGQHPPRTRTLTTEVGYLLGMLDWCANYPWVADVTDDIRRLHHQARTAAQDRPHALGRCLLVGCPGRVYPARLRAAQGCVEGARCSTCRRVYTGLDLARLAVNATRRRQAG